MHLFGILVDDVIQLDAVVVILDDLLFTDSFNLQLLDGFREAVIEKRPFRGKNFFKEILVVRLRNQNRAFSNEGCETAGVIGMRMAVDDVTDGFAWKNLIYFRQDGFASSEVLWPFDDRDVVFELNGQ